MRHLQVDNLYMNKRFFVTSVFTVLVVMSPFAASALTVADLQAQVRDLLAKIAVMQGQTAPSLSVGATLTNDTSSTLKAPNICGILNRNLAAGTRGEDVRGLQQFLTDEGYLSASATGYFGPATAQAVARWQSKEGVPNVGAVGPLTREIIKKRCGDQYGFRVTPQGGNAPLTVTAYANVGGFSMYRYFIDFGDGSARESIWCSAPADACEAPGYVAHTYTMDGSYTVSLVRTDSQTNESTVLAKESIRVGAKPVACTKEYKPVCGAKQVVCITTPCNPVRETYGNQCTMRADGATFVHEGACAGNTNQSGAPVISSFAGPVTLAVNETGMWSIAASDPENGRLTYSIIWGDEWARLDSTRSTTAGASITQETTFTHSYAHPGSYRVQLTVTDESGKSAKSTATVQVAQSVCTADYAPVCGRPQGCANTCAPGMICTMMCRMYDPNTYSNRCQMNNAKADFLHEGACTGSESY